MKLWISGEIQSDIADNYRLVRTRIENEVNAELESLTRSWEIEKWAFIAIIRSAEHPDYEEIARRSSRGKVLEFRLKIGYQTFKNSGPKAQELLIYEALRRTISLMDKLQLSPDRREILSQIISGKVGPLSG
jgi:hypothetical protein